MITGTMSSLKMVSNAVRVLADIVVDGVERKYEKVVVEMEGVMEEI